MKMVFSRSPYVSQRCTPARLCCRSLAERSDFVAHHARCVRPARSPALRVASPDTRRRRLRGVSLAGDSATRRCAQRSAKLRVRGALPEEPWLLYRGAAPAFHARRGVWPAQGRVAHVTAKRRRRIRGFYGGHVYRGVRELPRERNCTKSTLRSMELHLKATKRGWERYEGSTGAAVSREARGNRSASRFCVRRAHARAGEYRST